MGDVVDGERAYGEIARRQNDDGTAETVGSLSLRSFMSRDGMRFISQVASCLSRSSSDPWNRMPVTPVPSLAAHSLGFSVLYVHLVTSFATRLVRNGMEEESVA